MSAGTTGVTLVADRPQCVRRDDLSLELAEIPKRLEWAGFIVALSRVVVEEPGGELRIVGRVNLQSAP